MMTDEEVGALIDSVADWPQHGEKAIIVQRLAKALALMVEERHRIGNLEVAARNIYQQLSSSHYTFHVPELGNSIKEEFALEVEILRQALEEASHEHPNPPIVS